MIQFNLRFPLICFPAGKVEEKMVLQSTRNVLNQPDIERKPSNICEKIPEQNSKENNFDNFTCKNCGRAYTRKGNLGRHLKYECQKVPQFPCGKCSKKFYRKEKLQYHVNTTHSNLSMGTPLNVNISTTPLNENMEVPINLSTNGIQMDLNFAAAHINSRFLHSPQSAGLSSLGLSSHTNPFIYF